MAESMDKHREKLRVTFGTVPDFVPFFSNWAQEVSKVPGQCVIQFQTRPQSFHMSHASGKNMFSTSPHYLQTRKTANGDNMKLIELLKEPGTRAAILEDMSKFKSTGKGMLVVQYKNDKGVIIPGWMLDGNLIYPWTETYEPTQDTMASATAARLGKSALQVCYDSLLDIQGPHAGILWRPLFGYTGNNDNILDAFEYPNVIPGFDDAGAHCTILTDATCATTNISYLGRDRNIGRRIPLEKLVKVQTNDAAAIFGLNDRGLLKPGKRADLNILDLNKLQIKAPFWANDLPTKAGRWLQYAEGYCATILRGVVTFQHDQHTGELPGRLVRNPLARGLSEGTYGVKAASMTEDAQSNMDLTEYAVEVSREGGASAVARVLREQEGARDGATRSRL